MRKNLSYFDLTGKVAVVSGGATGIGYGISEGLAEAGATVVVCSRRLETCEQAAQKITRKTGAKVVAMNCDITKQYEIESLVQKVLEKFDGIDILVNCAGVGGSERPILKMEEMDWDEVLAVNVKGAYTMSRAVVQAMKDRGKGGRIINVASVGAIIAYPNMSAYCASKGALVQLTKVMALEWIRYGILVNAILPGYFSTPMNTQFFASDIGKRVIGSNVPMKRLGRIDEMKGLAILLASEGASFMTGSAVVIDGGYTLI